MSPTCRLPFLLFLALAASFLFVQVVDPKRAWSPTKDLLRIVEEKQRSEVLESEMARISKYFQFKGEIIRKLIDERLTLEEALRASLKLHACEFERLRGSGVEVVPVSRQCLFEEISGCVHWELRDNPSRACKVIGRLKRQWRALSKGCKPGSASLYDRPWEHQGVVC